MSTGNKGNTSEGSKPNISGKGRSKTMTGLYNANLRRKEGALLVDSRRSVSESPPYSASYAQAFQFPGEIIRGEPTTPPPSSNSMPTSRRVSITKRKQTLTGTSSPLHVAALFASTAKAAIGASNSKFIRDEYVAKLFVTSDDVFQLWEENMRIREAEEARKLKLQQQTTSSGKIRKISSVGAGDITVRRKVTASRAKSIDMNSNKKGERGQSAIPAELPVATITAKDIVLSKLSASSDTAVNLFDSLQQRKRSPSMQQKASTATMASNVKRRFSGALAVHDITVVKRISLNSEYIINNELGTGRFGTFKLAEHRLSKTKITLKFFPLPQTKLGDFIREYNYSRFMAPHPNAVDTFEGVFQTDDESAFFFAQEYCPYGSLKDIVEKTNTSGNVPGIGEKLTKAILLKVLSALEFMHSEGLVHRNLKAENILIFDPEQFTKVKVTEFGLTRFSDSNVKHMETVNPYQSPELCETVLNETLTLSRSIDIWSIGIIIGYCLKARFPWQKATIMCKPYWEWDQYMKHKSPQLPRFFDQMNDKAVKLFKHCLNPRPKDRWNVKDLKKFLEKETLEKEKTISLEDVVYYPEDPKPNGASPRTHRRSLIGQWLNTAVNTVSEISDQVVSARSED